MKSYAFVALAALVTLSAPAALAAQTALEDDGAAALGTALRRLAVTKRVLMIGAHPDDENTAVIAELALGEGADVAYLSLTRGEGGQNLIGAELQEGLGLIRTGELLAARRLDGAQQYFTRAYDYGFSKSADEAFRQWPRDSLLADVVEVVRRYRPDVIISVFSGTPADGHGQHQAAGILARAAFTAAADPARFPGQIANGLRPHRPAYLFQALWRPPPAPRLRLATGELDPLFGRSRHQIAMQSRSRHRSQDMGRAEPLGPQSAAFEVLAGDYPVTAASLFAGIDTTPSQHARTAGADDVVIRTLTAYEARAATARDRFNPLLPDTLLPLLLENLRSLRDVRGRVIDPDLRFAIDAELADAEHALQLASRVVMDVIADQRHPVPGSAFEVTVTLWNAGPLDARATSVTLDTPPGWRVETAAAGPADLPPHAVVRRTFRVHVPEDAAGFEPYFLREPTDGALYRWPTDSLRTLPFGPSPVRAVARIDFGGTTVILERDAAFATVDKALGEVRHALLPLPRASVRVQPEVLVIRAGDTAAVAVDVTVTTAGADSLGGTVRLDLPHGWRADPVRAPLTLGPGATGSTRFRVTPPADAHGLDTLRASFTAAGRTWTRGYDVIDYSHIDARALYAPAHVRASSFEVAIAPDLRIGYIEGAGDAGASALRQLGAQVELLGPGALANADLGVYDAIVAGIRAYEVRPDLLAHNDRLLEYVRRGGTLVVQYNKYELVEQNLLPYPATMAMPHGRVTDESAAVTLLAPEHPLLAGPNRIGPADFEGWAQERGLYFLETFDDRYTPLLAMSDAGEAPLNGALVAARVGDGWYVYTGLALFRQLPLGVPGAFRLLANMVSLGSR